MVCTLVQLGDFHSIIQNLINSIFFVIILFYDKKNLSCTE